MTVVIASAVIPTIFAQVFFEPREVRLDKGLLRIYPSTAEHYLHMPEE